jgi:hypothetical protein
MAGEADHKPEEKQASGLTRREALLQLLRVGGVAAGAGLRQYGSANTAFDRFRRWPSMRGATIARPPIPSGRI